MAHPTPEHPPQTSLPQDPARTRARTKRSANLYLPLIAQALPDALIVHDHAGRIVEANTHACASVGHTRAELLAMTVTDIEADADLVVAQAAWARMDNRAAQVRQAHFRHKDGRTFPVEIHFSCHARKGKRLYIAIARDMTQYRQAKQALAEREARYRAVIETTTDGFWMLDEEGHILAVNQAYARRSGYDPQVLTRMHIEDLEASESADEVQRHVATVRRQGNDLFHTWHRTRDGERWPVEVNASHWPEAGGLIFCFLRDIGERKRTEARLKGMHAEMEQLTRFQIANQTAAAFAHELNQPLNAISSYAEAALRLLRAGNPRPDKLDHAIASSALQAQRAGRVVREFLAFMNQNEIQTEPQDLNAIVRGVIARVEADGFGHVDFQTELTPDLAPVIANRLQVEKVLANLIENSIEAMREAGAKPQSITVRVATCKQQSMAKVSIIDSGPGIDTKTLQRIFEPFFSTKHKGLGMGLAISRAIIEGHGGQLWVDSGPGEGASFHFTLPFAEPKP